MMAYSEQFVLCVLHNNSPVREINGGVSLPFNSEYKVRLKNKHSYLRAKARVWVDGRKASNLGDFILKPGETLNLERFLDHSMSSGSKFKFVPLSDGRVNDPTDSENGIIKVEFYRETSWYKPLNINYVHNVDPTFPKTPIGHSPYQGDFTSVNFVRSGRITSSCFTSNTISSTMDSYVPISDSAGATVEGGHSNQQFTIGDDFQTDVFPTTLTLRVKGITRGHWDDEIEIVPARKTRKKRMIKFCPNCGARRHRQADHFCNRCGTAYHPRYEGERGSIVS